MMTNKCDVLVVGAGCSGSVCSLKLAREGFEVIVVEKENRIGGHTDPKIDITEDSDISDLIKEFELPVLNKTNRSKWFSRNYEFLWESKVSDLYFKRGHAEDSLDVVVMKKAVKSGAKLLLNTQVEKINFKGNLAESVETSINGEKDIIKPKIIIGADGFKSNTAKLAGLEVDKETASLVGYGILGTGIEMLDSITYVLFDREYAPGGYFYIGKTHEDEGIACVVLEESMMTDSPKEYYEKFTQKNKTLKKILAKGDIKNEFQGKTKAGLMKKHSRGNILLVGDAAGTLDPLFGYGIRNALLSAKTAVELIIEQYNGTNPRTLGGYDTKLNTKINTKKSYKHRKIFNKLNNTDIDDIVRIISRLQNNGINLDEIENNKIRLFKTMLSDLPSAIQLSKKALQ